jgi:hypothetical protein
MPPSRCRAGSWVGTAGARVVGRAGRIGSASGAQSQMHEAGTVSGCPGLTPARGWNGSSGICLVRVRAGSRSLRITAPKVHLTGRSTWQLATSAERRVGQPPGRSRWRWIEARLTPSVVAIAATEYYPERYISWATCSLWPARTDGRPPWRPRARAAASPAAVRSRIRSRSNSARAAKTWKTTYRPGWWCRSPPGGYGTRCRGRPGR